MNVQVNTIKENLKRFGGTNFLYEIPLLDTRYTDGLRYLAKTTDCYWLIMDASVVAKSLLDKSHFITIDLKKLSKNMRKAVGYDAEITYGDGNGNTLERYRYRTTDFPLDELRLYFVGNTLMLPTEY